MTVEAAELEGDLELGSEADHQVLEFEVAGDVYAVDVDDLVLIDDDVALTRLPRSPDAIRGVTDMRGDVTAVVDPHVVLDVGDEGSRRYLLVTEGVGERQKIGLLVDDVNRVRSYDDADLDRREELEELDSEGIQQAVVEGVFRRERDDDVTLIGLLSLDVVVDRVVEGVA